MVGEYSLRQKKINLGRDVTPPKTRVSTYINLEGVTSSPRLILFFLTEGVGSGTSNGKSGASASWYSQCSINGVKSPQLFSVSYKKQHLQRSIAKGTTTHTRKETQRVQVIRSQECNQQHKLVITSDNHISGV